MRSTLFRFSVIALPLAVVAGVVGLACGGADSASSFDSRAAGESPSPGPGGGTSFNTSDANSGEQSPASGSPLCGIAGRDKKQCLPDDDGRTTPLAYNATACAENPDAGSDSADAGAQAPACRLVEEDGAYVPRCKKDVANPSGVDGVACSKGTDCAPGFDCVDGEKGAVCRRYCCSGSCESQTSLNGGPTFCDVQTLVDYRRDDVKAPVCMPVKTCKLLRDGECSAMETCAVINEKGDTGCVALGAAKAGDSCDKEHCASGLTCLGSPGDRRCYKLCKVDGKDCGPMQTCTTASIFQDTSFGVCKDD